MCVAKPIDNELTRGAFTFYKYALFFYKFVPFTSTLYLQNIKFSDVLFVLAYARFSCPLIGKIIRCVKEAGFPSSRSASEYFKTASASISHAVFLCYTLCIYT